MKKLADQLAYAVENQDIGQSVVDLLLPNGMPHEFETFFFDYKLKLPSQGSYNNDASRELSKFEICEIIKDAAAFHNSYGGYIIFGVGDRGSDRVVGVDNSDFDVGDFGKRFESYTGSSVEFLYKSFSISDKQLSLLYIPRRHETADPASFKKNCPQHPISKKRAFSTNETYIRMRDECRPAAASGDDWKFLHGARRLGVQINEVLTDVNIDVYLPPRTNEIVDFVGRNDFLNTLREWFTDKRSPVRLMTGIGGLGKTAIAYEFCEELIDLDFKYLEKLVWLSAKERTYSSVQGKIIPVTRSDFSDPISLYEAILSKLGYRPEWDEEVEPEDYEEAISEALIVYKTFLVIDDIDSLSVEHQREVVFRLSNCINKTVDGLNPPSRLLFTSRTDQSLPPTNVIKLSGFGDHDFSTYVERVSGVLGIPVPSLKLIRDLRDVTSGSPLFAASLLRLVKYGMTFHDALSRWRGEDGVEARKFAFEKELKEVSTNAARSLYALCLLNETSVLELSAVLETSERVVRDSFAELQSYHLISVNTRSEIETGVRAPEEIILTRDVLRRHLLSDAKAIELSCARARESSSNKYKDIAIGISNVTALWGKGDYSNALALASDLSSRHPKNGDVTCLLATSYMKPTTLNAGKADKLFAEAKRLGSKRAELLEGWINAKEAIADWRGLVEITRGVRSRPKLYDRVFDAHIRGLRKLSELAKARNDGTRYKALLEESLSAIDHKRSLGYFNRSQSDSLYAEAISVSEELISLVTRSSERDRDKLNVFDVVWWLFIRGVRVETYSSNAAIALDKWWNSIPDGRKSDDAISDIIRIRLDRLEKMQQFWGKTHTSISQQLMLIRLSLAHSAAVLS